MASAEVVHSDGIQLERNTSRKPFFIKSRVYPTARSNAEIYEKGRLKIPLVSPDLLLFSLYSTVNAIASARSDAFSSCVVYFVEIIQSRHQLENLLRGMARVFARNKELKYLPKLVMCKYYKTDFDLHSFDLGPVDNFVVLLIGKKIKAFTDYPDGIFWITMKEEKKKSLQNLVFDYNECKAVSLSTTAGDCYLYNANPALCLIANTRIFQALPERLGCIKDLLRLKTTMKTQRIPVVISANATTRDVQRISNLLRYENLSIFKHVFVFLMSHGDSENIIYTDDGQYNIDESIIQPFLANEALKLSKLVVFVNACRGTYNPDKADFTQEEPNIPTDISGQDPRVYIFYSTKEKCVSFRYPDFGSPFIQEICSNLDNIFEQLDLIDLAKTVEEEVSKEEIFEYNTTEACVVPGEDFIFNNEYTCREYIEQTLNQIGLVLEQ